MTTNDSSTGGPLVPNPAPAPQPLEGTALLDLFQETFVGVSGIASDFIRPKFQTEDPNYPQAGTLWMSFSVIDRPSDTFPVLEHDGSGNGQDSFQQQERLIVLCSFYDNGAGGEALGAAAQLRDGLKVPQNMEALGKEQIALAFVNDITIVPSLLKQLWLFRCDLKIFFNRQVSRTYPILNLESTEVDLGTSSGLESTIIITQ